MSKSKLKIKRVIDPIIILLTCSALYGIFSFQTEINSLFEGKISESFPLKLIGPSLLLTTSFLLFRLFGAQVQHVASAQKNLVGIKSKGKNSLDTQIETLINDIERDQFSIIAQNTALIICSLFVTVLKPESTNIFICALTVLMLSIVASLFNHYFQLTKLVRKLDLQIAQLVSKAQKRSSIIEKMAEDMDKDPIKDKDHLKGYTTLH